MDPAGLKIECEQLRQFPDAKWAGRHCGGLKHAMGKVPVSVIDLAEFAHSSRPTSLTLAGHVAYAPECAARQSTDHQDLQYITEMSESRQESVSTLTSCPLL